MKAFGWGLLILGIYSTASFAAVGDQWILGIHSIANQGSFTKYTNQGYTGAQSSGHPDFTGHAYGRSGQDSVARIFWELSGLSIGTNRPAPTTTELYTVEFYGTLLQPGSNNTQAIEVDWDGGSGGNGEGQNDPNIPWVGQFGTNHQWINADPISSRQIGQWRPTGPGPQAPESADYNSEGFGSHMWMRGGSWLYAKWGSGFNVNRSWSAIRVTQLTESGIPGDHDGDQDVDANDYVTWRKTNIDGENGYNAWRSNYGFLPDTGTGFAVPEPAGATLLLIGIWVLIGRTRLF